MSAVSSPKYLVFQYFQLQLYTRKQLVLCNLKDDRDTAAFKNSTVVSTFIFLTVNRHI